MWDNRDPKKNDTFTDSKGKVKTLTSHNYDINYFCWLGVGHVTSQCPNIFFHIGLKVQVNYSSVRSCDTGQQMQYKFCYLLLFELWTSYLEMNFFLIMQRYSTTYFLEFPSSIRFFNRQQYIFQVWPRFLNIQKSFSYKDYLFVLTTQGQEH